MIFDKPSSITLPNPSYITNTFDTVARLTGTWLKTATNGTLNSHEYSYNPGNQRTQQVFNAGSTYGYTYDPIGQLTFGDSATASEDRGYLYDAAWNLNKRTNNTTVSTFIVDGKNQLTNAAALDKKYDANGNMTNSSLNTFIYNYDAENQLVSAAGGSWKHEFTYDGRGRLRKRQDYAYVSMVGYVPTTRAYYVYDGMRVIQERDNNNTPTVSYTRGSDLSGSLEGAGGIGGMLARSHGYASTNGNWYTHNFYHADGNGNLTYLVSSSQTLAASYRYDPYGNTISSSGSLAAANTYRFSSKEIEPDSGFYYYGYRWYAPNWQRWLNRDPIEEDGGFNLYAFDGNDLINYVDHEGLFVGHLKCLYEMNKWRKNCEKSIPKCPLWCPTHGEDGFDCEQARRNGILACAQGANKMFKACMKATMTPPRLGRPGR